MYDRTSWCVGPVYPQARHDGGFPATLISAASGEQRGAREAAAAAPALRVEHGGITFPVRSGLLKRCTVNRGVGPLQQFQCVPCPAPRPSCRAAYQPARMRVCTRPTCRARQSAGSASSRAGGPGDFQHRAACAPVVANANARFVQRRHRQVLAKRARRLQHRGIAQLCAPCSVMCPGVQVHRLVGPPCSAGRPAASPAAPANRWSPGQPPAAQQWRWRLQRRQQGHGAGEHLQDVGGGGHSASNVIRVLGQIGGAGVA